MIRAPSAVRWKGETTGNREGDSSHGIAGTSEFLIWQWAVTEKQMAVETRWISHPRPSPMPNFVPLWLLQHTPWVEIWPPMIMLAQRELTCRSVHHTGYTRKTIPTWHPTDAMLNRSGFPPDLITCRFWQEEKKQSVQKGAPDSSLTHFNVIFSVTIILCTAGTVEGRKAK